MLVHRLLTLGLACVGIIACADRPDPAPLEGALTTPAARHAHCPFGDCDDACDEGHHGSDCDAACDEHAAGDECDDLVAREAEEIALAEALAEAAIAPTPDDVFVEARVAALTALLDDVDDPEARCLLRTSEYQDAIDDLSAEPEIDGPTIRATTLSVREAFFGEEAAQRDAAAVLARRAMTGVSLVASAGDQAIADSLSADVAASDADSLAALRRIPDLRLPPVARRGPRTISRPTEVGLGGSDVAH